MRKIGVDHNSLPVVGRYLILVQFAIVREGQEVIDGLLN